jgi:endonuclease/exonuclease/phosphatase family metal-dependent hydrolase
MRARALLAAVAAALAAAAVPTAHADAPDGRHMVDVRVAGYNIAAGDGADHVFDVQRQIDALREIDADVISLEEVDVHWGARSDWRDLATEIADGLDMDVFFGPVYSLDPPAAGQPRREFGIALLSRYPILSAENHSITRLSTRTPDPVPEPAPGFPEILVDVDGALIHVYGTHLDYRADPAVREIQVDDTLRIMAEDHGRRQVLMGDFNARPDAPELAPLWSKLGDSWLLAGNTDPGFTFPASAPDRRIDYVAVSPRVAVRDAGVPRTLASDHRPVVADLTVLRGEER